jgi:acyl-CoA synthetase (AMP-forming)/AMP-acid ligase II
MLLIYQWARSQPEKTALIFQDTAIDYATLARAIEALRAFLALQGLPKGTTAIVMAEKSMSCLLVLALRAQGLTTFYAPPRSPG